MKINKREPIAYIYFFLNSVGLPLGLLYTTLFTPFFYFWIVQSGKKQVILKFLLVLLPFIVAHLFNGVDIYAYLKSLALFFSVYIFGYSFYAFINQDQYLRRIFDKILIINFLLTIVAIIALFTSFRLIFWMVIDVSAGINKFPRLSMGTYEASYYSTLLVPIITYFFLKSFTIANINNLLKFAIVGLSLILSFSLGVIAALMASMSIFFVINLLAYRLKKRFLVWILIIVSSITFLSASLIIFYPHNPLFLRITNVLAGVDSSARGRTFEAFQLAYIIAELKNIWWGVGLGQIKIIGDPIIRSFYNYPKELVPTVTIPCTLAETLAIFGLIGAGLRLYVEIYLFFKTKVLANHYRTLLFFFIFIYQFTGSYIMNIAEYVIWILAFSNCFPEFDKKKTLKQPVSS